MVLMCSFVGSHWSRLLLSHSGKVGCLGCNALQCVSLVLWKWLSGGQEEPDQEQPALEHDGISAMIMKCTSSALLLFVPADK